MATEAQYKVFKEIYDEETNRYGFLENRGKFYTTIITLYIGALAFKFKDALEFSDKFKIPTYFYLILALLLLISLIFTIMAAKIRNYEGICDPEEEIKKFKNSPPTDSEFFDDRIVDLAVATMINSDVNNKVASYLHWASIFLLISIGFHFLIFCFAIAFGR